MWRLLLGVVCCSQILASLVHVACYGVCMWRVLRGCVWCATDARQSRSGSQWRTVERSFIDVHDIPSPSSFAEDPPESAPHPSSSSANHVGAHTQTTPRVHVLSQDGMNPLPVPQFASNPPG